jgi:hypothetical protein
VWIWLPGAIILIITFPFDQKFTSLQRKQRYFKYHKVPIVGKILKPATTSVDVPSFSDDEIGLIVDEDDITIYLLILFLHFYRHLQ